MSNNMITNLGSSNESSSSIKKGFVLNQANLESNVFTVDKFSKTVNVWGLSGAETVAIHRVRTGQNGNVGFEAGDCCEQVTPPSADIVMSSKAYIDCGAPVVISATSSEYTIDQSGLFMCVYSGSTQCTIELIEDRVSVKNRLCGC